MTPEDKALVDVFMKAQSEPEGRLFSENVLAGLKAVLATPSEDAKRIDFCEAKAATVYCSESGHWVFVDERVKARRGVLGISLRECIDAAMKEAK